MRRIGPGLFVACLALSAAACSDPPGVAFDAGPAVVELGTGTIAYEPLLAEQDFGLVSGPQGGFHFIVHSRIRGLSPGDPMSAGDPGNPRTQFAAFLANGTEFDAMFAPYRLGYSAAGADWFELPSGRILVIDTDIGMNLVGERVRIRVEVIDAEARRATDERWVRVRPAAELLPDAGPPDGA